MLRTQDLVMVCSLPRHWRSSHLGMANVFSLVRSAYGTVVLTGRRRALQLPRNLLGGCNATFTGDPTLQSLWYSVNNSHSGAANLNGDSPVYVQALRPVIAYSESSLDTFSYPCFSFLRVLGKLAQVRLGDITKHLPAVEASLDEVI